MAQETTRQEPNKNRKAEESNSREGLTSNTGNQRSSKDETVSSGMNEKSSAIGRRDKGTGLSTKDGLTGSDYDGQLTE